MTCGRCAVADTGVGDPGRVAGPHLRGVLPGPRQITDGRDRHRPRPAVRPPARHVARRWTDGGQPARRGQHVHGAPTRGRVEQWIGLTPRRCSSSTTARPSATCWSAGSTRAGMAVVEADSGAAALDRIEVGDIDLVVLDVKLGDMSGFDVCEQIKARSAAGRHPRHPRLGARGRRRRPGAGTDSGRGRLPHRADRARKSSSRPPARCCATTVPGSRPSGSLPA